MGRKVFFRRPFNRCFLFGHFYEPFIVNFKIVAPRRKLLASRYVDYDNALAVVADPTGEMVVEDSIEARTLLRAKIGASHSRFGKKW